MLARSVGSNAREGRVIVLTMVLLFVGGGLGIILGIPEMGGTCIGLLIVAGLYGVISE
jgi:hypothetical protein